MKIMIVGASGGIGNLLTKHFDSKENELILTYNKSRNKIYPTKNAKSSIIKSDFTKINEVENAYLDIETLNVLINAIGCVANNLIYRMDEQEWDTVINTNLKSIFLSCRYGIPKMVDDGHIINFSSVLGKIGMVGATNYAASKGGVESFTKSLALECLHNRKIYVNAVALGYFKIGMGLDLDEKIVDIIKKRIPLKDFGEPDEIIKVVDYILSSKYLVGQVIEVNGGLLL
ncbi:MAG: SDR family oxidoreductase [Promethearchaeota archaeon]